MEPSDSKIKIFFQKKAFLIFQPMLKNIKNPSREKFLTFQEMELSDSKIKSFLYIWKRNPTSLKPGLAK